MTVMFKCNLCRTLGLRSRWYHSSDYSSLLSSKDLCRRLESSIWTWDRPSTHGIHFPSSHGQLNAIPKACHQAQYSVHACFEKILETNAGNLSVIVSFPLLGYESEHSVLTVLFFQALAWFCYDFVTYPFGIFSSTIIAQFNPNNTLTENIGYGLSKTALNPLLLRPSKR